MRVMLEAGKKVGRYETDDLLVSTVAVWDSTHPYETAVQHPDYNNDNIIIVENYHTQEEATAGHDRWVARMTSPDLPDVLEDCGGADVAMQLDTYDGPGWRKFPRKKS